MFGSIEPTPYDLQFTLNGIPVRVSIWFWVAGVILGYDTIKMGAGYLIAWLLILFISILVHEMGHALVARAFGYPPRILLYHFGGLAMYEPHYGYTRGRSIAISLAGPGAGFTLYGLTEFFIHFGIQYLPDGIPKETWHLLSFSLGQLIFINLYWGLVNLLPVLPLDGGRVCQEICSIWSPRHALHYTAQIGVVVAGLVAAYFFMEKDNYAAVLFAMLCAQNVSILQQYGGW